MKHPPKSPLKGGLIIALLTSVCAFGQTDHSLYPAKGDSSVHRGRTPADTNAVHVFYSTIRVKVIKAVHGTYIQFPDSVIFLGGVSGITSAAGGDITAVIAQAPITGGATSGAATIGADTTNYLATKYDLTQVVGGHDAVTLAGTPAYLTLLGQQITRLPIRSPWADTTGNDGLVSQVQLTAHTTNASAHHAPVTLAGQNYLSLVTQQITAGQIDLSGTHVTSVLPDAKIDAALARDSEVTSAIATHTSNATAHQALVTLAGTPAYLTLSGQQITRLPIRSVWVDTLGNDGLVSQVQLAAWPGSTNLTTVGTISTGAWNATVIDESKIDPDIARDSELHVPVTLAGTPTYLTLTGQEITRLPIRSVWVDSTGNDGLLTQTQAVAGYQPLDADLTDLADGSLTGTKVGFADTDNNFSATEVQSAIEELDNVNGSGPNAADGKVDWSQLVSVPVGFADGTDDEGAGSSLWQKISNFVRPLNPTTVNSIHLLDSQGNDSTSISIATDGKVDLVTSGGRISLSATGSGAQPFLSMSDDNLGLGIGEETGLNETLVARETGSETADNNHVISMQYQSTGTVAAGLGATIAVDIENDAGTNELVRGVAFGGILSTVTNDAETGRFVVATKSAGGALTKRAWIDHEGIQLGSAGVFLKQDGDGALTMLSLGNGSGGLEDLTFNLDDVSNEVGLSSSTGVSALNFGSIGLNLGSATAIVPNGASDAALATAGQIHINTTDEQLSFHSAADGEISGEVSLSPILTKSWSFDPDAVCDGAVDRLFLMYIGDEAPEGIIIDEWKISFEADPTTEADLDLKYADAFIGVPNAVVVDALDTTNGVASEDTDANINSGNAIPNGKAMYLEFQTAYTESNHQIIFQMWYHYEED